MYGHNIMDKIENEAIPDKVGVTSMMNKMRVALLRFFRHIKERCIDVLIRINYNR